MMTPSECFMARQGHTSGFTTALPLLDTIPDTAHSKSPTTGSWTNTYIFSCRLPEYLEDTLGRTWNAQKNERDKYRMSSTAARGPSWQCCQSSQFMNKKIVGWSVDFIPNHILINKHLYSVFIFPWEIFYMSLMLLFFFFKWKSCLAHRNILSFTKCAVDTVMGGDPQTTGTCGSWEEARLAAPLWPGGDTVQMMPSKVLMDTHYGSVESFGNRRNHGVKSWI